MPNVYTGEVFLNDGAAEGVVGNILSNNFGVSSNDNYLALVGDNFYFSATSNYIFAKEGTTAKTISDFPQFLRDTIDTTTTVDRDSSAGYYGSYLQLKDATGGTDVNTLARTLIPFATSDITGGAHATDFTVNGAGTEVTINTTGNYEISVNVGVIAGTATGREGQIVRCVVNSIDVGPAAKTGYIRIANSHNNASYSIATFVLNMGEESIFSVGAIRETTATGTVLTAAGESYLYIRKINRLNYDYTR